MWQWMRAIRREDIAQDLIEYTLLLAFVALAVIGLFIGSGGSVQGIWNTSGSTLASANGVTDSAATAAASPHHGGHGDDGGDHGGDGGDHGH